MNAIDFFLSSSAKVEPETFFEFREDQELWVEIEFEVLTEQESNTFKRYVRSDGTIRVRKTAAFEDGKIQTIYNGYIQEPEEWWLHDDDETVSRLSKRTEIDSTPLSDSIPSTGRITKAQVREAQEQHIMENVDSLTFTEKIQSSPLLGLKNVAQGILPEFYLIPAVKDLSDEVKIKAGTSLGRLLNRAIQEIAATDPRFEKIKSDLEGLVSSLKEPSLEETNKGPLTRLEGAIEDELSGWDVDVEIEVTPPEIEKIFELGTTLFVDDGIKTIAERKGHGLQRAIMFAMIRAWAAALRSVRRDEDTPAPRKASESVIFGMEEPELFLHPHAQRRLAGALSDIAKTANHQVFLCTHSTHFVDLDMYQEIVIVSKETPQIGTKARQCTRDLFEGEENRKHRFHMARWVNPDRAEMFFAKRTVFVEGETEQTLLPYLADMLSISDPDISIIDCGSKFNLRLYIEIANAFRLNYVVVHDEDPVPDSFPDTWNNDRKQSARNVFAENELISTAIDEAYGYVKVIKPNFEKAAGISRSQSEKMGKPIAALDFFSGRKTEEIPVAISDVVKSVYSPYLTSE